MKFVSMAPRLAKSRFIIIIGFLIFLSISFFVISKNQIKNEELTKISSRYEMQNKELQEMLEKKMHLEKTLQQERSSKKEANQRLQEQKEIHDKSILDSNTRFESLKQQYKLLKSQHEDLQESSAKLKEQQSEEINGLEHKVQLLQSQLTKLKRDKDSEMEMQLLKYQNLEKEKTKIEKVLRESDNKKRIYDLEKEVKELKEQLKIQEENEHHQVPPPAPNENVLAKPKQEKNFDQQQVVSDDLYKIPIISKNLTNIDLRGISSPPSSSVHLTTSISSSRNINNIKNTGAGDGIINSVENFQMIPKLVAADNNNVLPQPNMMIKSSSTTTTTMPASKTNSKNNQVVPLVPAMTPSNKNVTKPSTKGNVEKIKKNVPSGVVWPVPDTDLMDKDYPDNEFKDNQDVLKSELKDDKNKYDDSLKIPQNNPNDINELENGAHEINDNNDFNIDKDHDHMHDLLDSDKNLNNNNNAAEHEDDTYDMGQQKVIGKKKNDKLMNEIVGDHGKEGGYPDEMEDLHLDNHMEPEEEGDVGEYDDPKAFKQGIAVRN